MRVLIFLEMGLLYSGFNVMFPKTQSGCIFSPTFKVREKKVPLFLYVLAYFPRYGHFMDFTLLLQQNLILQYIFPNYDGEREVRKKLTLFLILEV